MLLFLLAVAALAPGACTAWLLRRHGWPLAILAGAGVTLSLPLLLAGGFVVFPGLGVLAGMAACLAALSAYDDGRVWAATTWAGCAAAAFTCAGWSR
jgi:hypothetical protein